jgi:hypothetical protein
MVWASHKLACDRQGGSHQTCDKRMSQIIPRGTLPTLLLAVHEVVVVKMQGCPTDNGQPTLGLSADPATLQVVLVHQTLKTWSRVDANAAIRGAGLLRSERGQGR